MLAQHGARPFRLQPFPMPNVADPADLLPARRPAYRALVAGPARMSILSLTTTRPEADGAPPRAA